MANVSVVGSNIFLLMISYLIIFYYFTVVLMFYIYILYSWQIVYLKYILKLYLNNYSESLNLLGNVIPERMFLKEIVKIGYWVHIALPFNND